MKGLRARGGFEVSVRWEGGRPVEAGILSHKGEKCAVLSRHPFRILEGENAIASDVYNDGVHRFPTKPGFKYLLVFE
ncbi:glycoside hydrolase family 95-like protein [Paenibacillus alkalitolerans]|uniref:glycoside hydrolase family 95-like protein n=1 Tax=Paenibacillus alkalitolerans TaxID=2799335 RepID=UPI002D7EA708|nr:hypothetical protein [Paenibacillus alkalitolerans]